MLLVELSGRLLGEIYNNNLIVLPLFSLIEMIFFLYFYNKFLFIKPNKLIMVAGILAILFIVGETLQYFVFNTLDTKQYQPYAKVIDNFVIIIMALYFFYQKINNFNETRWGNFRLNTAILIVFTFNSLVFLPFNFLINESSGIRFYFWTGNLLLLVFFYIYLISLIYINGRANRKIVR
ncbi:hypothetical protein GR160_07580 [Flavobacterium sp. Sd200]|nr:hypothetical protein [Flavobacterium sp. Sd200]